MKWFKGINNLKELHKMYVKLSKENHPDRGGNAEAMKEINVEYKQLKEQFKNGVNFGDDSDKDITDIEGLQDVLSIICGLAGIEIELCGRWLWISGNTYAHKDILKKAGCFWAAKKMQWYWHSKTEEKPRSRGRATAEYIRARYGSTIINADDVKKVHRLAS